MTRWHDTLRNRDIILISPQCWSGMWVSKHWIADQLSVYNRVLFVEPGVWVGGLLRRPLSRWHEFPRAWSRLRRIKDNLFVSAPLLLPGWYEEPSRSLIRQLQRQIKKLHFCNTVLINFSPCPWLAGNLNDTVSVYYCVDPPFAAKGEEDWEALTCRQSDCVYAISDTYRDILAAYAPDKTVHVIPHGFPVEYAQQILSSADAAMPAELAALPRPIIGYTGSVHDGYVDIDLMEYLSRVRPSYSFALVGPYKNNPLGPSLSPGHLRRLRKLSNVHLLGYRPFQELPKYVKWFDACLVLHDLGKNKQTHQTKRRTPFKLLQYLAQGKPIIAPDLNEMREIRDLVYLADGYEEYVRFMDRALEESQTLKQRRMQFAQQFSFDKTLERIVTPIREAEQRKHLSNASADRRYRPGSGAVP